MNERNINLNDFEEILNEEEKLLNQMIAIQADMKTAVHNKDWEELTRTIHEANAITENFVQVDSERELIQETIKISDLQPYFEKIGMLRSKLFKCKVENQVLNKYVNITKEFIQSIIENALPQSRSKVYSNKGKIVQPQPQSVVVSLDF